MTASQTTPEWYIPKCCPINKSPVVQNPLVCIHTLFDLNESLLSSFYSNWTDEDIVPEEKPLDCIQHGRMYVAKVLQDWQSLQLFQEEMDNKPHCIDTISRHPESHSFGNDTTFLVGFHCGDKWPYRSFVETDTERLAYGICTSLSILFLASTIFIQLCLWNHQTQYTKTQMQYFLALMLAYTNFLVAMWFPADPNNLCTVYYGIYTSLYAVFGLATITFLCILSYDLFCSFWNLNSIVSILSSRGDSKRYYAYVIAGWGLSFAVQVAVIIIRHYDWKSLNQTNLDVPYCLFLYGKKTSIFIGQLVSRIGLGINVFFFVFTFGLIVKHDRSSRRVLQGIQRTAAPPRCLIKQFWKLFLISGVSWTFLIWEEVIGTNRRSDWYLLVFRCFLLLQGGVIFALCMCNRKTMQQLSIKYPCLARFVKIKPYQPTMISAGTRTTSTGGRSASLSSVV